MSILFTSEQLAKVCGISLEMVEQFHQAKLLQEDQKQLHQDRKVVFGIENAVAILVGAAWKKRGASDEFYKTLVSSITDYADDGLKKEFAIGRTYIVRFPEVLIDEPPSGSDYIPLFDLKPTYDFVVERYQTL